MRFLAFPRDHLKVAAYLNELAIFWSESNYNIRAGYAHLLIAQVKELIELNTTVREGTERPLLLEVGSDLGVGNGGISLRKPRKNVPSAPLHRLPYEYSGSTHHLEGVVGGLAVGLKAALLLGGFGTESETRPVADRL